VHVGCFYIIVIPAQAGIQQVLTSGSSITTRKIIAAAIRHRPLSACAQGGQVETLIR